MFSVGWVLFAIEKKFRRRRRKGYCKICKRKTNLKNLKWKFYSLQTFNLIWPLCCNLIWDPVTLISLYFRNGPFCYFTAFIDASELQKKEKKVQSSHFSLFQIVDKIFFLLRKNKMKITALISERFGLNWQHRQTTYRGKKSTVNFFARLKN